MKLLNPLLVAALLVTYQSNDKEIKRKTFLAALLLISPFSVSIVERFVMSFEIYKL